MQVPETRTAPFLLLVDDDPDIREQLRWAMSPEYVLVDAHDRQSAIKQFGEARPRLVILDLGLPPHTNDSTEGLRTLEELLAIDPRAKVIVVTGNGERENARKAIALGAYDFLDKPVELEQLKTILGRAAYVSALEEENRVLRERSDRESFEEEFIGSSPPIQKLFETMRRVAEADIPVLITGESGTGKELMARALHKHSRRKDGPLVSINCAAIPESLLESELFGHEKGAFTGAHTQRKGRVELAHGGTLFLDEIGDLPLAVQVKLLRFLQDRKIERIGGRVSIEVDVRIISATHKDLAKAQADGTFREDLYYRLCGVSIFIPPLRERNGDVFLLADRFVMKYAAEFGKKVQGLTEGAKRALQVYQWPGNVRELENRIKRAVVMADGLRITEQDLELQPSAGSSQRQTLKSAREKAERELIAAALSRNNGNISKTAVELDVSRPTLHHLIDKYSL